MEGKGQPGQAAVVDHCHEVCEQWTLESKGAFHLRYHRYLGLQCFRCHIGLRSPETVLRSSIERYYNHSEYYLDWFIRLWNLWHDASHHRLAY